MRQTDQLRQDPKQFKCKFGNSFVQRTLSWSRVKSVEISQAVRPLWKIVSSLMLNHLQVQFQGQAMQL